MGREQTTGLERIFYYNGLRKIKFSTHLLKWETLVPQPQSVSGYKLNWFNVGVVLPPE